MREVGLTNQVTLYAPRDAYFSYFNSPYIGHELGNSIDIYPGHQEWGGSVLSPVNGIIVKIKKIKMGRKRNFPTEPYDFGIAIKPEDSIDDIVRILHSIPELDIGDRVDVGDYISSTLRSRYFDYWTGPHYHVDIMKEKDFGRSSKSFPLTITNSYSAKGNQNFRVSVECEIIKITEDILIAVSGDFPICHADELTGLAATSNDSKTVGLLDGGISHYRHGGIWTNAPQNVGEIVELWRHPIGQVSKIKHEYWLFRRGPRVEFKLDGLPVRGLSCFIFTKYQLVQGLLPLMIIPVQRGQFVKQFDEGDVCLLSIHKL